MDSGAQCVMITLDKQKRGLLAINLGLLQDTTNIKLLVHLSHCEYQNEKKAHAMCPSMIENGVLHVVHIPSN